MKRRCFLALGLLFCSAAQLAAQQPDFAALDSTVRAELAASNTPGAALAIVSGDSIVYAIGYGIANVETGAPVTPDMLFRIGSTTKMYTTALVTMLAEEGKLSLDAPIGDYITGLPPGLSAITAHQLMTHTAGLRDYANSYGAHDTTALATAVRGWSDRDFFTEPARVFSYSNIGMTLAGFLAQEVADRPYARLVDERILKPLGMRHTTFEPTQAMTWQLAQGHAARGAATPTVVRPFADNAGYWPAGFLFSSVLDLSRFAIAFMAGGQIDGRHALSQPVVTKLSAAYTPVHSVYPGGSYGYGLFAHRFRGVRVLEHGGAIEGFGTLFRMVPDHQFAVIILANKSGQSLEKSAEKAMELMLHLDPPIQEKAAAAITPRDLRDLVGRYAHAQTTVEITNKGGTLHFKQGPLELPLTKIGEDHFSMLPPGASRHQEIVAVRGSTGRVEFLHAGLRALARQ